jgi:hypothetical protein
MDHRQCPVSCADFSCATSAGHLVFLLGTDGYTPCLPVAEGGVQKVCSLTCLEHKLDNFALSAGDGSLVKEKHARYRSSRGLR